MFKECPSPLIDNTTNKICFGFLSRRHELIRLANLILWICGFSDYYYHSFVESRNQKMTVHSKKAMQLMRPQKAKKKKKIVLMLSRFNRPKLSRLRIMVTQLPYCGVAKNGHATRVPPKNPPKMVILLSRLKMPKLSRLRIMVTQLPYCRVAKNGHATLVPSKGQKMIVLLSRPKMPKLSRLWITVM